MDKRAGIFRDYAVLKPVILRSISKNQILILSHACSKSFSSVTKILVDLSEESGIPLSTLKLKARELREMKLLEYGDSKVKVTELGKFVLKIAIGHENKVNDN